MVTGIFIGVALVWLLFGAANALKYTRHQRKLGVRRSEIAGGVAIALLFGLPSALFIELFCDDNGKLLWRKGA